MKTIHPVVDSKVKKIAVQYLKSKMKSKGKEIQYGNNLMCQGYLLPNSFLTLQEQRAIFNRPGVAGAVL